MNGDPKFPACPHCGTRAFNSAALRELHINSCEVYKRVPDEGYTINFEGDSDPALDPNNVPVADWRYYNLTERD